MESAKKGESLQKASGALGEVGVYASDCLTCCQFFTQESDPVTSLSTSKTVPQDGGAHQTFLSGESHPISAVNNYDPPQVDNISDTNSECFPFPDTCIDSEINAGHFVADRLLLTNYSFI